MKTKPITLILSLLLCLSGSVFAENYLSYKPFNDFYEIHEKIRKSIREIGGITQLLDDKIKSSDTSKNINNSNRIWDVAASLNSFHLELNHMREILKYESVIIKENIKNIKLINAHKEIRESNFRSLDFKMRHHKPNIRKIQIEIDNTTAVIAINSYLKIIDELEEWYKKNKEFKINEN